MAARRVFSIEQVEQLRALLAAPPAPPRPTSVVGIRNLLSSLKPQLRALVRAGYEHEQIAGFFAGKGIELSAAQIKLVAGSGRVARKPKTESKGDGQPSQS